MLSALDHVAVVVRDLQTAAAQYTDLLGCAPTWHGAGGGAEHVWFQLANTALDIIAPSGAGLTGDAVRAQLERDGEGVWAIAFATPDIAKARHVLARRGVASAESVAIRSKHIDRTEERSWTTAVVSPDATYGATILLVEQKPNAAQPNVAPSISASIIGLDHVVVTTAHPERAAALYGARLGLEMKLDRTNPEWGSRLMFFRCGDLIVEIAHSLKNIDAGALDKVWGLSWRTTDIVAAHARLLKLGFAVSEIRVGRKPGTQVFTVRDKNANVPTLVIGTTA